MSRWVETLSGPDRVWPSGPVTIDKGNLAKILAKIRGPNEPCKICGSGLCVVCKAYDIVEGRPEKTFMDWDKDSNNPFGNVTK